MDPRGPAAAGLGRVGRDGRLRLRFERRGGRTVVSRCGFTLPLQVLGQVALDDPAAVVSMLNPTGGIVGGDHLSVEVEVGPGAHACLTTPSATKVYRTGGACAVQEVAIRAEAGAVVEWVPDHAIPFAGAALRQRIEVEVADSARLVLVDAFSAGRVARGEAWAFRLLDAAIRVRDSRGWLFLDRARLAPGEGITPAALGLAEATPYVATVVVIADGAAEAFACAATGEVAGARLAWARLPRRGAVVRCLAPDAHGLVSAIRHVWAVARRTVLDLPPLDLRKP